jgi:hypothetical protein
MKGLFAMNAATLTSARDQANQGPDGDHVFVLACRLGRYGPAVADAVGIAQHELAAAGPTHTHLDDQRVADRVIELINLTDPAGYDAAISLDADALRVVWDDLAGVPGGAEAFIALCVDGNFGESVAAIATAVTAKWLHPTPAEADILTHQIIDDTTSASVAA